MKQMKQMKHLGLFLLVGYCVLLSACSSSGDEEIRQWMLKETNEARPKVMPLPEPKPFKPEAYTIAGTVEPFNQQKLTQALKRDSTQVVTDTSLVAPELARRKEPLEAYPLDAMTMVGHITKQGQPVALVRIDKLLYQIRPGQYLGLNYGKVMKISESEVTLREIVQDAAGEWIERVATLELQEKSK